MEKELNLLELLKDAPKGTKLYSPIFGECELDYIRDNKIYILSDHGSEHFYTNGNYLNDCGECLLFPSRDNRDWSTFEVEKDFSQSFLIAEEEKRDFVGNGFVKCCANFKDFKEGENYWLEYLGNDEYNVRSDNLLGKTYNITPCQLYTIFKKLTWLEKRSLFKVGDHVKHKKTGVVCVLASKIKDREGFWSKKIICPDDLDVYISEHELGSFEKVEKFDPKWLKPFDRVLVRCEIDNEWFATLFSHLRDRYILTGDACSYKSCVPYNEETKHLVGTADEEPTFYKID